MMHNIQSIAETKKNYVVTLKNIYFDISRDEDVLIDENPAKREMSIEKKKKRVTIITSKRYVVKQHMKSLSYHLL